MEVGALGGGPQSHRTPSPPGASLYPAEAPAGPTGQGSLGIDKEIWISPVVF